jgi:hypothetical protein
MAVTIESQSSLPSSENDGPGRGGWNAAGRAKACLPLKHGWENLCILSKKMLRWELLKTPKHVVCFARSRVAQRQFMRYKNLSENGVINDEESTTPRNRL